MTHRFPKTFLLVHLTAGMAAFGVGCAQKTPVQYAYRIPDARAEAFAIEAAKQHPNAQPRVRPQYPEQAPPRLPQGSSLPPPAYVTRRAQPLQLSEPSFDDTSSWSGPSSGYRDFAPSYTYPYGYYAPAYPAYGYRLGYGGGWRSGYSYGGRYTPYYSDPWPSPGYRDFDRPRYHRHDMDHHHNEYRPSLGVPRLGAPSHSGFHSQPGDHGSRPPRTDVRVRR